MDSQGSKQQVSELTEVDLGLPSIESTVPPEKPPRKKISFGFIKRGNKKRIIAVLVVIILAVVAVVFITTRTSDAAMWKNVTEKYKKAEYAQAADLLGDTKTPKNAEHLSMYADIMLATRDLDRALPAYQALYDQNKSPDTEVRIGNIYNEQKKYDKAAEVYQSVIKTNPGYVQAYVNLATVHLLQSDRKAAVETAKTGVEANAGNVTLNELLVSLLLEDKSSSDYISAVAALEELNPQSPLLESIKQ